MVRQRCSCAAKRIYGCIAIRRYASSSLAFPCVSQSHAVVDVGDRTSQAYSVGSHDASCIDTPIGVTTQPDVSSCQNECSGDATCEFVAYCPPGTSGCEGGDSGSCVTYATCATNSNQGYTLFQKATTTTQASSFREFVMTSPVEAAAYE